MDRSSRYADVVQRRQTRAGSDDEPGRSTLTDALAPSGAPPARPSSAHTWPGTASFVDERTAQAHGLVQFDASEGGPELDGAEAQTVAAAGFTGGGGGALPHLAQVQRAFGRHDVTGVRAHVGGAAADSAAALGARAYASGDQVAFARPPDLFLAAHEAAHVVQQRGGVQLAGGVGRSGDSYERHADEVAAAVVAGGSAEALLDRFGGGGGGGGAAVQRDEDDDEDGLTRAQRRELRRDRHRAGRQEAQEVYLGTDVGVVDAEGAPVRRHVGGGDAAGRTALGGGESVRGGTTRTRGERDGRPVDVDEIDEETRTLGGTTTRRGTQEQALDAAAMAADLRSQLEESLAHERTLVSRGPGEDGDPPGDPARIAALEQDVARLRAIEADDDPEVVADIARRHRMLVAPRYRAVRQDLETRERGVERAGAGIRRRDRTTTERTSGEETVRSVRETSQQVDLDAGSFTARRREEDEVRVGDARGRRVDETTTGVTVDEGVRGRRRREERRMLTDADGAERETAEVRERRGGIVADDDGWGLTGGRTRRESERRGDEQTGEEDSVERRLDVTVREDGASARAATDRDWRRGATTYGTRSSADGSFTIDIERQNSETPPTYRLVFTIHVGVAGRAQVQHGSASRRGVRGGIHARGEASGDLVLRRTITAEQAEEYWAEAQRAERRGASATSALPEFQRLARVQAGLDNADQLANATAIAGSADGARGMSDGEEVELTVRGTVGVGGSLGHRGEGHDVGVEAERAEARSRRVLVSRITVGGAPRVRVTVTYERDTTWHVEGEGSVGGGPTVGVRRAGATGDGDSVRFTLDPEDPDFDAHYAAIVRTTGRDELRALAEDPDYQDAVDYTEETAEDESSGHEEVAQGAGVRVRRRGRYDERVRRGRDGSLSGEASGSLDTSLELRAGEDTVLAQGGTEGSSRAAVERDGQMDVTLQEREHGSDPVRTARAARDAMRSADGETRARHVLGASPGERLRALLSTEYSTLRGFHLDEDDVEVVVARAGDRARWEQCASSPRMLDAWQALRGQLRSPDVQADEAEVDRVVARRLAIARHLARFYQAHGEYAQTAMHNVLRNWGRAGLAGVTRDSDADQLGSEFEWPHGLRSRQTTYQTIRAEVRDLERAAAGQATQGDVGERTEDERYARALHLHEQLTAIYTAVAGSSEFDSEGARASLLRHIDGYRTRLRRLRVSHREQERVEADAARAGRDAPDQLDQQMRDARVEQQLAQAQVDTIIRRLEGFKAREQAQLRRANELSYSYGDRPEAVRICGQLHAMAQTWYEEIRDLRRAYETLGTPPGEWQVSQRGGTRSRTLEPEVGWLIQIYLRCHEGNPVDDGRARAAQWREQFRSY